MILTRQVKPRDLGKYERNLARELPRMAARLQQQAARKSIDILQRSARSIRPYPPIDSKRYVNSFEVLRGDRGSIIVTNSRRYSTVIEEGRRPNARRPPVSAIAPWVQRKFGLTPKRARGVAFAVARKIGKRGIMAKRVVSSSMPEISATYLRTMYTANNRFLSGRRS